MARKTKAEKERERFAAALNPDAYQPEVVSRIESNPYDGTPKRITEYDGTSNINTGHRFDPEEDFYACVKRSPLSFSYWNDLFMRGY